MENVSCKDSRKFLFSKGVTGLSVNRRRASQLAPFAAKVSTPCQLYYAGGVVKNPPVLGQYNTYLFCDFYMSRWRVQVVIRHQEAVWKKGIDSTF